MLGVICFLRSGVPGYFARLWFRYTGSFVFLGLEFLKVFIFFRFWFRWVVCFGRWVILLLNYNNLIIYIVVIHCYYIYISSLGDWRSANDRCDSSALNSYGARLNHAKSMWADLVRQRGQQQRRAKKERKGGRPPPYPLIIVLIWLVIWPHSALSGLI